MAVKTQVNTVAINSFLADSGSFTNRCLARGPSGRLWACYIDTGVRPNDRIYAAFSDDGGINWTEELAVNGADAYLWSLCMVVDSSGVPHLFYGSSGGIPGAERRLMHAHRTGGIWAAEIVYDAGAGINLVSLAACIHTSDLIHLVWNNAGIGSGRHYTTGTTGAWAAPEAMVAVTIFQDIDVDSAGIPYVVYETGAGDVRMIRRVAGVWQAPEVVAAAGWAAAASFDGSDNLHVIWLEVVGGWVIVRYRKRSAAGVWGAVLDAVNDWTGVADAWPPSLGVDSSGNSYVVVQKDNHLGDESVYLKQVTAAEGLGALTVFDAVILMPNANPSVYSSLWHGGSQYSLVPASFQPVALLLSESGINADGFFELYGMGNGGGGGGPLLVVSAPTVQTLAATGVT